MLMTGDGHDLGTRPIPGVSRRTVLGAVITGGLLSACARTPDAAASTMSGSASAATTSASSATALTSAGTAAATAASLPAARSWTARPGEVSPGIKRVATTLLEHVGTWTGSHGDLASARHRLAAAGYDPALAAALSPLLGVGTNAVAVVRDAQYGGLLSTTASVLVVVDQWRLTRDGVVHAGGTTVDVRLAQASPHWRVVEVHPASPGMPTSALTRNAREVLRDTRIRLPHAARADVSAGRIHDSVLALLLSLGQKHVVDVSVLRSGHPLYVFGTSRTSDHPKGRAADVWALDGRALVLHGNHTLAASAMRYAVAHGAYNVGGPILLGGPQYFSDHTHQDHIHLGYNY